MPKLNTKKFPKSLLFCFISNNVITCCNSKDKNEYFLKRKSNENHMEKNGERFKTDVADGEDNELYFSSCLSSNSWIKIKWLELRKKMCV